MKKLMQTVMAVSLMAIATETLTSCAGTGGASVVTSVQTWLNDPKNQAIIQEIAAAANILIGAFANKSVSATQTATVTGKLAQDYPNVPAGALTTIAKNPAAYLKK